MSAFRDMNLPIASYAASWQRWLDDSGHPATMAQLRLRIHGGTASPHHKPVTEVQVTFGKPSDGNKIGRLEEYDDKAMVFATVPLAEFETYWAILHHDKPSHVDCGTDVGSALTLGYFALATQGFDAP